MRPAHTQSDIFRPVSPPRHLSHEIAERIAREIITGDLAPGTRLPTEQEMGTAMGVSRTVVREAVAALRAEGLVVTRQGAGAFVASDAGRRPFRLALEGLPSLDEVLSVMELRAGVETEAAGLAATRGTAVARRRIRAALGRIDAAIRRGENAVDEDFAFHGAIAGATGNPQFSQFLEYLGRFIIPRQSIRVGVQDDGGQRAYLERIQSEHEAIVAAIDSGAADPARAAMRQHLTYSQERYRRLAIKARDGAVRPGNPTGAAVRSPRRPRAAT